MGRVKTKRELSFKPKYRYFAPDEPSSGKVKLLHEEIEALFLIDYQELYQEDAAIKMGVSRPTFSRIIKSARTKVATALIGGKGLIIDDEKDDFTIAFICDDPKEFGALSIRAKHIVIANIDEQSIKNIKIVQNPLSDLSLKPSMILPNLLERYGVNFFITSRVGEGLKNSLLAYGIFAIYKDSIDKESIKNLSIY
ncbi:MAG: DUF134 domain-containing protein [Sulfurimonadaceae bacterium]|jgi:predicted DNA-binding protein (UPF0251 family)/predicted Fe-Mo cluster-binding NifX family protein|nr:DUF134 domain-containing protein [Sulfurimonadaceae bacterium]